MKNKLMTFTSSDRTRKSVIVKESSYIVKMYDNDELIETRDMSSHNVHYARSCAENFVNRVGEFKYNVQEEVSTSSPEAS